MLGPLRLTKPGLFVTGTDTGVGKTVVTCAIAWALRQQLPGGEARVAVCKPFATGCRKDREGLVSEDAEALAHFSDCREPLDVINPVRFVPPVAPAVAAEMAGAAMDFESIALALRNLDAWGEVTLIEGVGGLLVPIDPRKPTVTVLDLAAELGYPVVIVCRATLGTLNHTAMTARLLKGAGCRVAGLVVNGYHPDSSQTLDRAGDASMSTNRRWLEKMNGLPILATVPACPPEEVKPERGVLPGAVLEAVGLTYWMDVAATAVPVNPTKKSDAP